MCSKCTFINFDRVTIKTVTLIIVFTFAIISINKIDAISIFVALVTSIFAFVDCNWLAVQAVSFKSRFTFAFVCAIFEIDTICIYVTKIKSQIAFVDLLGSCSSLCCCGSILDRCFCRLFIWFLRGRFYCRFVWFVGCWLLCWFLCRFLCGFLVSWFLGRLIGFLVNRLVWLIVAVAVIVVCWSSTLRASTLRPSIILVARTWFPARSRPCSSIIFFKRFIAINFG